MICDDKFDEWIDLLCTCETYWQCEWHRRLRGQYDTRSSLGEEMEQIIETSHAVEMGAMELPEGWERIQGKSCEYWAPPNRDC